MNALTPREQLLVALGSALGSNCVPCVEAIVPKATALGMPTTDIEEAVNLADAVRRRPFRKVLDTATGLLRGGESDATCDEEPCPLAQIGEEPAVQEPAPCCDKAE